MIYYRQIRPRRNVDLSPQAHAFLTSLGIPPGSWTGPLKRCERKTAERWLRREERAARPPICQSWINLGKAACVDGYVFWLDVDAFRRPGEARAYLGIRTPRFHFRERMNGRAELTIFNEKWPETLLIGIEGSCQPLRQLVHPEGWFFETGDPVVLSASSRESFGTPEIILRLRY